MKLKTNHAQVTIASRCLQVASESGHSDTGSSREDNSGPVDFDMVIDIDERAEIPGRNCQVFS